MGHGALAEVEVGEGGRGDEIVDCVGAAVGGSIIPAYS